jgi:maltose O-acetyltransferase
MKILLQIKFFLVAFLNFTKEIFPYPLRNIYLRIYGIKVPFTSSIHRRCRFFHIGKFSIGKNSVINSGCYLDNRRGIFIGNNTAIAHDTKIYTLGHNINSCKFETKGASVKIGSNCFIFSNVLIMPGVNIGDGAVILPGAVVTKSVPAYEIYGGNPARKIKDRNNNIDYVTNYNYWFAL